MQVKNELGQYTIPKELYKLGLEALNEEESARIDKHRIQEVGSEIKRIKKLQETLLDKNLAGTITDEVYKKKNDEFEVSLRYLADEKEKLESPRFDWREIAEETFSFARYANEDFENDSLENRKIIMKMLGDNLEVSVLGRTISFSPVKWLIPIRKAATSLKGDKKVVRTGSQQRKNGPLGTVSPQWCA